MADDLSLLFKIRGDASGAKQASAETRAAIAQLRTQTITDSRAIQQSTTTAAKGPQSLAMSLQTVQTALQGVGGPLGRISPQLDNASSLMGALSSQTLTASGSIAAIAGPVGLAVTAFAALTTGVTVLVHQFAALVVSTAQWEGKLYDLSQQTGVSVETLSTLSALADDTGGSIEGISQSLVIFQGHLDEAQDLTTKMGEKFTQLGISTNNTEQAFRDALRVLAAMPEGFRQTNEAAELFGRRGGKQVLAILKETQGDIDGTTEKLRALNSLVTTDVARGADQLNDQLNSTQRQFRGLTAQIVNESMPLIVRALQDLSKILRENRELFILLGQAVGLFLQGNFRILAPALDIASRAVEGHKRALLPLIEIYERLAAVMQLVTNSVPSVDPNAIPAVKLPGAGGDPGPTDLSILKTGIFRKKSGGGAGGGGAPRISEGQRLLNQLTEEYNRLQEKANELTKVKIVALEILDSKYKNLSPTLRDQIFQQAALIDQAKEQADSDKRKAEATEKIRAFLNRQNEAIRAVRMGNDDLSDSVAALEAELKKLGLTMDADTKRALENAVATRRASQAVRERIALEQTRIDMMERERLATPERKQEQLEKESGIFRSEGDEERQRRVAGEVDQSRSAIDQLFGAIDENLSGAEQTAALAGLEALTTAFSGLGQAVGAVVEAWVLYGSAGTSVRKVTAQILAGVAQQAAVKAVFELAEGFAALAMAFFGVPNAGPSASAHFTAAAIYGSIAAVAAVAGRSIAGDSFKKSAEPGGGSGSSRSGGSSDGQSAKPGTTDVNRNAIAQPMGTLTINLGLKDGVIADGFKKDYMLNGVTRLVIKTDGQG